MLMGESATTRKEPMYYQMISQCTQALKNLEAWLDKAEQHAAAKKFDVSVLMTSRLAPDMKDFIYQVQSACDYVKAAAAWLSGQRPPKHEDNERTIDELRARIGKTVAFAESVKEPYYASASERKVTVSWAPGKVIGGEDYLLQMTIPNTFFHIAMAKRLDWSRSLPQPLQIFDENDKPIITLKTLGDVRKMLLGLPEPFQLK